jgi:PrgI family protein
MRHEIPTHLNVEDKAVLGLTARQLGVLIACSALAYRLWDQWPALPLPARAALAAACVLIGLTVALIRPGGRPLEQWALAGLAFVATPRRTTWAVAEPSLADWRPTIASGWVELTPSLAWVADRDAQEFES